MNGIDARPRSATEIIDAAFNVLRQRYGIYVTAAAIMYVPILVLTMAGYGASGFSRALEMTPFSFTTVLLQLAWITITNAALSIMTSHVFLGGEPDTNAAIGLALRRGWPIVAAGAITMVISSVGLIFLLVPGVYFFARFGLSTVIAAIEGTGPIESLRRASFLSKNNKLHYLSTLAVVGVLYIVVSAVTGIIVAVIKLPAAAIVTGAAVSVFLMPLAGTVHALIYYDVRIRNEGFDIQLMSDRLAPSGSTAG